MRLQKTWLPLFLCGFALIHTLEARRVRVQPQEEQEETIQYYTAEEPQDGRQVVYISSADQYNGLYGQPAASARSSQDNYIPQSRSREENYIPRSHQPSKGAAKVKDSPKTPPVQTIRNYNKVNDDGSFTFGYEAADGSFKEETRGTDCVVRGKYGYVDPDGNKREFTYVSGNPCDPNAPKEEDLDERPEVDKSEPDDGIPNYPTRQIRPIRPVTVAPKPAVSLYQNNYAEEEDEQPEPEQILRQQPQQQHRARPVYISRPQYEPAEEPQVYQRQRILSVPSTTPASVIYKHSVSPVSITPRPVQLSTARSTEQPATTYRPQLLQVAVTPRPSPLYTKQIAATARPTTHYSSTGAYRGSGGNLDFDAEFQKFQQENNIIEPSPSPSRKPQAAAPKAKATTAAPSQGGQVYSSELVYDPSSGQYNTQLYQTLPQTEGDFTLNHRIQPYVHQPSRPVLNVQQLQQQSPLYRALRPNNNQALYQQQQAELQFQNSAQLYAQQQKQRSQASNQQTSPQQFYYIQPSLQQPQGFQGGQIDAFLRGHNIQF